MVGVPLITPLAGFRLRPAGSDPENSDQVKLPAPPVAVAVWEYAMLTVPPGKEVVVNEGADVIAIDNG